MPHGYNSIFTIQQLNMYMQNILPMVINDTPLIILDKNIPIASKGFTGYIQQYLLQSYQELCIVANCYICARN